jgi:hypothetical protein
MSYFDFLTKLLSSGKIAAILKWIEEGLAIFNPNAPALATVTPTDAELKLEGEIAVAVGGPNAAFDGSRLRALFKFLQDSGLLAILLLTKTVSPV